MAALVFPTFALAKSVRRVTLHHVWCHFGANAALRRVSTVFGPGVAYLITGPNGSGKSTLLRVVAGICRASRGSVIVRPRMTPMELRKQVGWVSHESLLYPDLSARENVLLAARLHGCSPHAWEVARDRFGLSAFADRPVRSLSRGQVQRVSLGRALVHEPSLVLLDEPSSGLDADGVAALVSLVQTEVDRGKVLLVVTHDTTSFASVRTRRLRLQNGSLVRLNNGDGGDLA